MTASSGTVGTRNGEIYRTLRQRITESVGDIEDRLSDSFKMNSLLLSMVSRMWSSTPQTQKDLMDPADVLMIDAVLAQFATTTTRADNQFSTEGVDLVTRLLQREAKVAQIIAEYE